MIFSKIITISLSLTISLVEAQSFCSSAKHSGQSVRVTSNKVGSINGIGYELWADSGNNSATFYSDGSFSCSFQRASDYLCRSGLSFDSTKTHQQIGHMYADFKLIKQNINNVGYSYVGIYGWTRNPLVEFYVVDNWLSSGRPGDWVGNRKHGDYTIDGAQYTVYENTRNGPSIDGNTTFKQFFSIRKQARDCGTIDITAHFEQWEKLGMRLGKMHEAKVLGEAGTTNGGTSGTADFPYAKVYIGNKSSGSGNSSSNTGSSNTNNNKNNGNKTGKNNNNNNYGSWNSGWNKGNSNKSNSKTKTSNNKSGSCSSKILKQGYKCCSKNCIVYYVDNDGNWGYENNKWCGCNNKAQSCKKVIGYPCCKKSKTVVYKDKDGKWSVENNNWCLIA